MKKSLLAVLFLMTWGSAAAQVLTAPTEEMVEGLYWDPAVPGEGYFFSVQEGFFFATAYTYDEAGIPTFFTFQGTYTHTASPLVPLVEGEVYRTTDYSNTEQTDTFSLFLGDAMGEFTLQWGERSIDLVRFWVNQAEPLKTLKGVWMFALAPRFQGELGTWDMYRIEDEIQQADPGLPGEQFVVARPVFRNSPDLPVYDLGNQQFVLFIDEGEGVLRAVQFSAHDNAAVGVTFLNDGSQDLQPAYGFKLDGNPEGPSVTLP